MLRRSDISQDYDKVARLEQLAALAENASNPDELLSIMSSRDLLDAIPLYIMGVDENLKVSFANYLLRADTDTPPIGSGSELHNHDEFADFISPDVSEIISMLRGLSVFRFRRVAALLTLNIPNHCESLDDGDTCYHMVLTRLPLAFCKYLIILSPTKSQLLS